MENKVKFHALERLDLLDVDAQQDNTYTYIAKALGNLVGNAQGLLQRPVISDITVNNSTDLIGFPDFVYIEAQDDTDFADSFESRVIAFDASLANNGTCNFDTVRALVQAYYGTNNSVPDGPRTSGYDVANDALFPYIFVLKREIDTTLDNRRFWSVSNNTEETLFRDTRKKFVVDFLLSSTVPAGGYTKIGRIIDWNLNGGTIELSNADQSIELYTFTDDVYFTDGDYTLDSSSEYSQLKLLHGGGLKMALRTLRKQIEDIRGNGSADAGISGIPTSAFNGLPYLSLDGLYQRGSNLEARINHNRKGSVIFTLISDPANNTHTIETDFYTNTNEGSLLSSGISAYYDYEFLHTLASTNVISSWSTDTHWSLANSVLAIDFGETYSGYGIRMSVNVVNALALKDDAPNLLLRPIHAQPFSDDITSGANYNDIFKVSNNTYQNLSDTATAFKGVKVSLSGVYDYFDDKYDSSPFTAVVRIPVKIDFELIKP